MKHRLTISMIICAFVIYAPSVVLAYLTVLGFNFTSNQFLAALILAGIGSFGLFALGIAHSESKS